MDQHDRDWLFRLERNPRLVETLTREEAQESTLSLLSVILGLQQSHQKLTYELYDVQLDRAKLLEAAGALEGTSGKSFPRDLVERTAAKIETLMRRKRTR